MSEVLGRQWPRRVPVTDVGFQAPRAPVYDPEAMTEGGSMQPPETRKVVGALFTTSVKPQRIDPSKLSIRATQPYLTRGSLLKHLDAPKRGRGDGPTKDTPVLLAHPDGHHYVLDGHHRLAGALQRGESIDARVLDVSNPAHHQLAQQYDHAEQHVRSAYGAHMKTVEDEAKAKGLRVYGPGHDPDLNARIKQSFAQHYPEYVRNPERKAMGLPPKRRR